VAIPAEQETVSPLPAAAPAIPPAELQQGDGENIASEGNTNPSEEQLAAVQQECPVDDDLVAGQPVQETPTAAVNVHGVPVYFCRKGASRLGCSERVREDAQLLLASARTSAGTSLKGLANLTRPTTRPGSIGQTERRPSPGDYDPDEAVRPGIFRVSSGVLAGEEAAFFPPLTARGCPAGVLMRFPLRAAMPRLSLEV
jgi:hypothetical protein